jgi:PAS domain S-box-containing protein
LVTQKIPNLNEPGMKKELRLLIVEDSEDDTLLVIHQFKKGGYDIDYERVETAEQMKTALKKNWDIILADYRMPHFNGLDALKLLRETGMDIPFIIISGTIGEETAVEAMKAGAHDYIMKNNLYRLLPAIEREIRESNIRAERKELEQKQKQAEIIKESEAKLKNLVRDMPVGVILRGSQAEVLLCNTQALELLGLTEEQLLGKTPIDPRWNAIHEDGSPFPLHTFPAYQAIEERRPIRAEIIGVYHPEKRERVWLLVDAIPQLNDDGSVKQVVSAFKDISKQKMAEEKLLKLNTAVEQSPVSIVVTDKEGIIEYANPFCTNNTGYENKEIIGKNPRIFKSGLNSVDVYKKLWDTISAGNIWRGELCNKKKNGDLFWESISISPVKNSKGTITHYIGVKEDITKRKRALEALKESEANLRMLNAEKDKFFSIIAHDLRSPFVGFLGLTELMAENLDNLPVEKMRTFALGLHDSAVSIFRLLENLLEWAKIQRGLVPFGPELMQLFPIIKECLVTLHEPAQKKEIDISVEVSDSIVVKADCNMLKSVIRNLVSNAIKFTPHRGKICLSVKTTSEKSIEIAIKDTGIGMSKNMTDNLFSLDVKTNRPGTDDEPSSGLGLILCKEFIEKHRGKIWVESEEGKGSTFFFTIPYE